MKKVIALGFLMAGLAACAAPVVPDSGAGVGFNDYAQYELERAQREAALNGSGSTTFGAPEPVTTGPLSAIPTPQAPASGTTAIGSDELARAGIGQTNVQPGSPLDATAPVETEEQRLANLANNPGISDEQDFSAVADRETIESDAQRRAAQAAELVVVDAVPLPTTRAATGANIVAYALNAPNVKGQEWYSRSILSGDNRFQRNCASYNNADEAQRDFLSRGGPDRDSRGIDPDGDGFACGWDPAPFKLAAGN